MDDEYFRLMIAIRQDTGDHPEVKKLLPTIYKSLERRLHHGLTNALFQSMTQVEITSPGGLYLGHAPGYNVNLARLDRVAARIAKGLFYHEFGYRLPDDYEAVAYSESGLASVDEDGIQQIQSMCAKITASPPKTVGTDVFSYWFGRAQDAPNVSAWILNLFKNVSFFCITLPREMAAQRK